MKSFIIFLAVIVLLFAAFLLAHNIMVIKVQAAAVPQIIINEIMYNPQGSDTGREWVEILNVSTSTSFTIDSHWRFNDGSNHLVSVVQGNNVFSAGQHAVLADNPNLFLTDYPGYQGILLDTVMSLNNTADTLTLSVASGQNLFATTTYQTAWGGSDNGYSLERINLSENWQQSFVSGGTPGTVNSQAPTPVNEATDTLPILNATSTENVTQATTTAQTQNNMPADNSNSPATSIMVLGYSPDILINEVLPNPEGSDNETEFIELYNRSSQGVNLAGWQLGDSTSFRYTINRDDFNSTEIPAYGYFLLYRKISKIALNNTGDAVRLYQPDGSMLDSIAYGTALEQWSYAKNGDNCFWTNQPTPGRSNIINQDDSETSTVNSAKISENSPVSVPNNYQPVNYQADKFSGLRINEFLPDPVGSDISEWIELYNNSSSSLNLFGFKLDDEAGGSRPYAFSTTTVINPFGFLTVKKEESKISLNNTNDEVRLIAPTAEVFSTVSYAKPKAGWSYNFNEPSEDWFWSASTTPNQTNVVFPDDEELDNLTVASSQEEFPFYSLSEVKELAKGEKVKSRGVVVAAPGVLGKRVMYLAEVDVLSDEFFLDRGLQIYSSFGFPENLREGDLVEVEGKVSQIKNEPRINLIKGSPVQLIKKLSLPKPSNVALGEIDDSLIGGLIAVSGQLTEKKGVDYSIIDETGEIKVSLKKIADKKQLKLEPNYQLAAVGILTTDKDGYCLLPRTMADVNVGEVLGASEETASSTEVINLPANNQNKNIKERLLMIGGTVLTALIGLVIKFRK
ncbi:MAG: lamin tail domain-containing protein [Candidatus Komeilibacteria bacterium]|nr:lamin tail domain-containing protein [Candidatus Komeilibacteria bacterium]